MHSQTAWIIGFQHGTPTPASQPLVVIIASGPEDGCKRATLAWTTAVTAMGDTPTRIFLVGDDTSRA